MNDPGLDEPAQEAAQDVENKTQEDDEQAEQEERKYLDPSYVPSIVLVMVSLS
jgi:potassium channel subfamily K